VKLPQGELKQLTNKVTTTTWLIADPFKNEVKCIEKINPISSAILILDFDDPKHINFINLLEARLTQKRGQQTRKQ